MTFDEIIDRTIDLLQKRGRVTYRTLKRHFSLDDAALEDLKHELVTGQRVATDEGGEVLVWGGSGTPPPPVAAALPAADPAPSSDSSDTPAPKKKTSSVPSERKRERDSKRGIRAAGARQEGERAERRQITVIFCDLVGSTTLSTSLDPEDLRELVRAYQQAVDGEVARFGGYVAQYLGDGVLAYFGWPVALEDAAERAVRAALGSVEVVRKAGTAVSRARKIRLSMRVGIHTGVVVVGEVGAGEGKQQLALGEAPNMAARLQGFAEPDTVVITESTQRLVARSFDVADLGQHILRGISGPVTVYRVVGETAERGRDDVRAMVGRDRELLVLQRAWIDATHGKGSTAIVTGQAGIGKSRLTQAVRDLAAESATRLSFRCSPYHTNTALHPVIEHLERRIGITRDAPRERKLALLREALLRTALPLERALPLLAQLLGIANAGLPVSPQRQKLDTLELIASLLEDDAAARPVLAVWEDVHWADATTIDLLSLLVQRAPKTPILHVMNGRMEFSPPFRDAPSVFEIGLSVFSRLDADALVAQLFGGRRLTPELLALVIEKTDGVPLFIEEIAKVLLEGEMLVEKDRVLCPKGPLAALAVPSTLHDSLMARLDRMSAAREVAQLGATIGREFSYDVLSAIAPMDDPELEVCLQQLVDAQILFRPAGSETYVFTHALIQDVAYQSLLRSTRQGHHEHIAMVLEESFPSIVERQPEVLAHHFAAGGMPAMAIPHLRRAGERAVSQSAYIEAVAHLNRALDEMALLPPSEERDRLELDLQILRGVPLTATRGYGASEVRECYARALAIAGAIGESARLFPSLYGVWRSRLLRAEYRAGAALAMRLQVIGDEEQDMAYLVAARRSLGSMAFYTGEYDTAVDHMHWVIAAPISAERLRTEAAPYEVVDSLCTAHSYLAWSQWMLGDPAAGCRQSDRAVAMANDLGHGFTKALTLSFASWLHQFRRDVPATRLRAEQALAISAEKGLEMWLGWGHVLQGWTFAEEGKLDLAIDTMRDGIETWRANGAQLGGSYFGALLAEVEGRAGHVEVALATITEAQRFAEQHDERYWVPEVLRVKAEILARAGAGEPDVRKAFEAALDEAKALRARMLEVRIAAAMFRHLGRSTAPVLLHALSALGSVPPERDVSDAAKLL
jgi:class 3 adenylate cyclase/predicted ATPase